MKAKNRLKIHSTDTIDVKGSLGVLAFGDIGLREWRKVKKQVKSVKK